MASLAAELFLTGVSVFTVVVTVFPTTDETVSFGVHKLYFELASSLQLYIYIYCFGNGRSFLECQKTF